MEIGKSEKEFIGKYNQFLSEEFVKREVTAMNIDRIMYEGLDLSNPRLKLMDAYWVKRYVC